MGTPGLGYSLYLFDGRRGKQTPKNGYGICLYDSMHPLDSPIIKEPVLQIDRNSAGTVSFTLLAGAKGTILSNDGSNVITEHPDSLISEYVCYMQTEIVVYRTIRTSGGTKTTELWAGRVYSIKKDFYNNWKITAEGSLAYFNDFAMLNFSYKDNQAKDGGSILNDLVAKYNAAINNTSTDPRSGGNARTIKRIINGQVVTFAPLDRRIYVNHCDRMDWKAATYISNSDNSFTISDGTTYMSAFNSLLSRYGGYFEIIYTYDNDGYSKTKINWYSEDNKKVHKPSESQKIRFGVNLLDYVEDIEDSEFFTALYPMGSTNETKTDEDGKKSTKTKQIFVTNAKSNEYHTAGSPYIYDNNLVNAYGFIEKKEKWEIGDANELLNIATKYYKLLALGEPIVEINAFDLKNLLTTDINKDEYLDLTDSLYLYDKIRIQSDHEPSSNYNVSTGKSLPIIGIEIPLDKFPTDTKYTMSNKNFNKNALAPGNIPGVKPEDTHPDPDPTPDDEDPDKEEDKIKYLRPVGGELGIDAKMPHYPPVYLRRSASRWECTEFSPYKEKTKSGTDKTYDTYVFETDVVDVDSVDYVENRTPKYGKVCRKKVTRNGHAVYEDENITWTSSYYGPPAYGVNYTTGYAADPNSNVQFHNAFTDTTDQQFIFFSDNMASLPSPIMRIKDNRTETKAPDNDRYEIAYVDSGSANPSLITNPLNSYDNGYSEYYEHEDANVHAGQQWRSHFAMNKEEITLKFTGPEESRDFKYYWINENFSSTSKSAYSAQVETAIGSLPIFGDERINSILESAGFANLSINRNENCFDIRMDFTVDSLGTVKVPLYRHLINYWPSTDPSSSTSKHMGLLASWTNKSNDVAVIYYSYINGAMDSPIPLRQSADGTIDGVMTHSADIVTAMGPLKNTIDFYMDIIKSINNLTFDCTSGATGSQAMANAKQIVGAILSKNNPGTVLNNIGGLEYTDETGKSINLAAGSFDAYAFPTGIAGLNEAWFAYKHGNNNANYDTARANVDDIFKDSIKLKMIETLKPVLIITKVKEIASGGDQYGIIFSGGNYKTDPNSITKVDDKFILNDDILLSDDSGNLYNPIMFCRDTMMSGDGGIFEYDSDEQTLWVKNGKVTHLKTAGATAPTMTLTKCGGPHTGYISDGVYAQIGGSGSFGNANSVWHTEWPVYIDGEPTSYPGTREVRYKDENSYAEWFKGDDMRDPHVDSDFTKEGIKLPKSLSIDETDTQKYLENVKYFVPIAVGADLFIRVGSAFIKNMEKKDGEEGGN